MRSFVLIFSLSFVFAASVKATSSGFIDPTHFVETTLETERLSAVYRERLTRGLEHLKVWIVEHYKGPNDWMYSVESVNCVLANYVFSCKQRGLSMWLPKHAILGVQTWYPHFRNHLHRPWDCIRAWRSQRFLGSRPPLQPEILFGLFGYALNDAFLYPTKAHLWFCFAVLVRVAFHGLLRPGEFLALRCKDVFCTFDESRNVWVAVLAIGNPKTRNYLGCAQFTTLDDQGTVAWLR